MVIAIRMVNAHSFVVVGRKTWISGQNNEAFGVFWQEAHGSGLIETLSVMRNRVPGPVTNSTVMGISCVEKDPEDRVFDFYIAAEFDGPVTDDSLERYVVPAAKWAVFANRGTLPGALVEAEMYAFGEWLPSSGFRHAMAPELEVYPARGRDSVEFWLPVVHA